MLLLFWSTRQATTAVAQFWVTSGRTAITIGHQQTAEIRASSRTAAVAQANHRAVAVVQALATTAFGPIHSVEVVLTWPIADIEDGGWTNELGLTTNLYASIDEPSASDADYIQSSPSPVVPDEVKLRLGPVANPNLNTEHVLRYRYQKDASGGERIDLTVRLYRADGSTLVAETTHEDIGVVTDGGLALTYAEAGGIPAAEYDAGLVVGFSAQVPPPPPPFSPASVPDLAIWLDADLGAFTDVAMTTPATADGATVRALADLSGNGHHALERTAAPANPTYRTGVYNGLPTIRFAAQYLTWGTDDTWLAPPLTLFLVMLGPPQSQSGMVIGSTETGFAGVLLLNLSEECSFRFTGDDLVRDDTTLPTPLPDPPQLLLFRAGGAIGALSHIAVNNASVGVSSSPLGAFTLHGNTTVLAASSTYGGRASIDLCALVAYHRTLTVAEIDEVQGYLAERYGITLSW